MEQQALEKRLLVVLSCFAQHGRGPFGHLVREQKGGAVGLTNAEIEELLEQAYGHDLLNWLDGAGLSKLYERDLEQALGTQRARIALKFIASDADDNLSETPAKRWRLSWAYAAACLAAVVIGWQMTPIGEDARDGALTPPTEGRSSPSFSVSEPQSAAYHRDEPSDFSSCEQYLGHHASMRCFRSNGGDSLASSPEARDARRSIDGSVARSSWGRDAQCPYAVSTVDAEATVEGMKALHEMTGGGLDTSAVTAEDLFNACSGAANRAAYTLCSTTPVCG